MSEVEKTAFDEKRAAEHIETKAFDSADRLAAGYSVMDNDAKSLYDVELLNFKKKKFEDCEANPK